MILILYAVAMTILGIIIAILIDNEKYWDDGFK